MNSSLKNLIVFLIFINASFLNASEIKESYYNKDLTDWQKEFSDLPAGKSFVAQFLYYLIISSMQHKSLRDLTNDGEALLKIPENNEAYFIDAKNKDIKDVALRLIPFDTFKILKKIRIIFHSIHKLIIENGLKTYENYDLYKLCTEKGKWPLKITVGDIKIRCERLPHLEKLIDLEKAKVYLAFYSKIFDEIKDEKILFGPDKEKDLLDPKVLENMLTEEIMYIEYYD